VEFTDVAGFAADAVGEPGARTFLLQFYGDWGRHTYLLEKGQVAALAAGADQLMKEIGVAADPTITAPILIDELPRFRIAQLSLGFSEEDEQVLLTIQSVSEDDEAATYRITVDQLGAAARQGAVAVEGGRPRCPNCGLAMDPDAHACPATNGDLRHYRA
jgi:uncharacterized repeat protein (TIGR03847 family)